MIGREREIKELNKLYENDSAELIAIYGRLGDRKTYLVEEVFSDRITFRHTGLSPESVNPKGLLNRQLEHFYSSLTLQGVQECKKPKSWFDAFLLLEKHLLNIDDGSGQLVFIDELPWLDSPRSEFISAFEGF